MIVDYYSSFINQQSSFINRQSPFINHHSSINTVNKEDLKHRTKKFAHSCVKLSLMLPNTYLGNHIKGQLIRCSTSVAANYRAVCLAHSKASFISKMSIVIEEADEAEFWLEFIKDENLLPEEKIVHLQKEAHELASLFISARKTAQKNL